MPKINIVAATSDSTVVSEYVPEVKKSSAYQSEAALEHQFIEMLKKQSYEYLPIHKEEDLIANLRKQIELVNEDQGVHFTDSEWKRFYEKFICNDNLDIVKKTQTIQEDYIKIFEFDNGNKLNIRLIDKENVYNNRLQVINQYENNEGTHKNRYDVTILVNGLPLVHVELKRRGVALKQAFNQIRRYERESFWSGCGLYNYVQIFVISNGRYTKYYSNTTRDASIKEDKQSLNGTFGRKTSNSFEFTSYWATSKNKTIPDLIDFTKTFFAKGTLLNILTKYCVFTVDKMLLVMRPYQIVATEEIIKRIEISNNYKKYGTIEAGGYIWHTTGSGKTLTSFKTAQIASNLSYIDKVLFVVDRKDLDYQTMREFNKFEADAANGNTSTAVLKRQLEDVDKKGNPHKYKIIVTTIQKLDSFVSNNPDHPVYDKHVVLIFDECHRSQFGDMHTKIIGYEGAEGLKRKRGAFKKFHMFGFTGTPIFSTNAGSSKNPFLKTTEQAFGDRLHTYTIVDAINDENVLPFRIDYVPTMSEKAEEEIEDKLVKKINKDKAWNDPDRIALVTKYILDHFNQQTKRNDTLYTFSKLLNIEEVAKAKAGDKVVEKKVTLAAKGFNSIFAVSSIPAAKLYYEEFKRQLEKSGRDLKIATIFSFSPNEDEEDFLDDESPDDTEGLDATSKEFLEKAIKDYCEMFNIKSAYDTSSDKFANYYKDVSLRMKNREIDILIVVNMFLTGFDATTLNTLWVDKNLKQHGLIQAFSRTNRILNTVKTFGNIICFRRKLKKATEDAIALFGDSEASGIVLLKTFKEYYEGYTDEKGEHRGYIDLVKEIHENFPVEENVFGEANERHFIKLFGQILRMRNILSAFDEFEGKEIISDYEMQDYTSTYLTLHDKWKPKLEEESETINDDIVFEIGLVQQVEVNIDYILMLVAKYHETQCKDKSILGVIEKAIGSSTQLRSKKELIKEFIGEVEAETIEVDEWTKFVNSKAGEELHGIIVENNLKEPETIKLMENSFKDGNFKTTGTDIDKIMPPMSRFGGGNRTEKKKNVIQRLLEFFEKFFGLI